MLGYNDNMRWGESIETQDESNSFYAKALKFKAIDYQWGGPKQAKT